MNTQRIRPWLLTLGCLFIFVGCAKRPCGEPLPETPASITGTQWKLTRSNDPGVNNILTPFTFSVFTFNPSGDQNGFRGTIQRAVYNVLQEEEQAQQFYYEVQPGFLSIELIGSSSAQLQQEAIVRDYYYELSRQGLEMQDAETGAVYTFCPYTGGEAPDAGF